GRLVLHDHALAERLAKLVGDEARRNIGRSTGAEADHQPDRPRGIWLFGARRADASERQEEERAAELGYFAGIHFMAFPLALLAPLRRGRDGATAISDIAEIRR